MSSARRIGLLTGTFDPVHLGHVAMAEAAGQSCGLDEVWFLVNPDPGHKVGVTDFARRRAMIRLAVEDRPKMKLYDGGLAEKPHNIDVFLTLINGYPADEFVFIVGADVMSRLNTWDNYERVVEAAQFAVARRRDDDAKLDGRLRVQWFDLLEHAGASSRDIRREVQLGQRPADLDARVYDYIREQGLYI